MSFSDKGFWMTKESGHVTDGDAAVGNSFGVEQKRSYQWFADSAGPQLFPNKRQAVQPPDGKSAGEFSGANLFLWENSSSFQPAVQNQFIDRLFGSEESRPIDFVERNASAVGIDGTAVRRKVLKEQYGEDTRVDLSISHGMEDSQPSYGGIRKVRLNQVKDHDNKMHVPKDSDLVIGQECVRENETNFISMGNMYIKENNGVTLAGQACNQGDEHLGSAGSSFCKGDEITVALRDSYNSGDKNIISFGSFPDVNNIIPVCGPEGTYDQSYHQSVQPSEPSRGKEFDTLNANAATTFVAKSKIKPSTKNKIDVKLSRREAPNSFPSNVRSLISTGMLDGVPVKYVTVSRQVKLFSSHVFPMAKIFFHLWLMLPAYKKELHGIIKGSGYLCGCQTCNYSKVLNAYEFERHADCKTKHPNNHIYFDNGKTIYQIVQELSTTPESLLFDAIQNAFGSPINQKAFRTWKESFQAATRELQRIYGKEELNL